MHLLWEFDALATTVKGAKCARAHATFLVCVKRYMAAEPVGVELISRVGELDDEEQDHFDLQPFLREAQRR